MCRACPEEATRLGRLRSVRLRLAFIRLTGALRAERRRISRGRVLIDTERDVRPNSQQRAPGRLPDRPLRHDSLLLALWRSRRDARGPSRPPSTRLRALWHGSDALLHRRCAPRPGRRIHGRHRRARCERGEPQRRQALWGGRRAHGLAPPLDRDVPARGRSARGSRPARHRAPPRHPRPCRCASCPGTLRRSAPCRPGSRPADRHARRWSRSSPAASAFVSGAAGSAARTEPPLTRARRGAPLARCSSEDDKTCIQHVLRPS